LIIEGRAVFAGSEEIAYEAAERVVNIGEDVLKKRQAFRIVLSGGSTPKRLYEILADSPFRSRLPWNRVHFFWGDERCVASDQPDSNYRMVRQALLKI
jgi:6-phosphogluconolactonase